MAVSTIPLDSESKKWFYSPTGSGVSLQGGGTGSGSLQSQGQPSTPSSSPQLSVNNSNFQNPTNPQNYVDPTTTAVLGASTSVQVDPVARAAAAQEAADRAKQASLRGDITTLANRIKDIFNSRYGVVDQVAGEQVGKLNERFGTESSDLTNQIASENEQIGAASAARGTFDSSYRSNNVDTVTKAGEAQIRDLGLGLEDDIARVGEYVSSQKKGYDAQKTGIDKILSTLAETTDINELTTLRNTLDNRITELSGENMNTESQNVRALEGIAPTASRSARLQTTLSQILAGNADAGQKATIGRRLINSAGLSPEEKDALLRGFNAQVSGLEEEQKQ